MNAYVRHKEFRDVYRCVSDKIWLARPMATVNHPAARRIGRLLFQNIFVGARTSFYCPAKKPAVYDSKEKIHVQSFTKLKGWLSDGVL